jgi:putative phosphoribosyl transferase
LEAAVDAVMKAGPERVVVAVTTGHEAVASRLAKTVQAVYCPNVRGGWGFSLREAFRHWHEVTDREAEEIVRRFAASTAA